MGAILEDYEDNDDLTLTELQQLKEDVTQLDDEIDNIMNDMNDLLEEINDHCLDSKYGHYCQLQIRLSDFSKSLAKFLSNGSKRPRGKMEFIFNNAIEYVGGGVFMAEHSGYEQTNGRALNTLQNFTKKSSLSSYS